MQPPATLATPARHLKHVAQVIPPFRDRLLRLPEVEAITGMKKTRIYEQMREGRFPQRIAISRRFTAWSESAVLQWVQEQVSKGGQ